MQRCRLETTRPVISRLGRATASLILVTMAMPGLAEDGSRLDEVPLLPTDAPSSGVAGTAMRHCASPLIDFEEIDPQMQRIIDQVVRSIPPIEGQAESQQLKLAIRAAGFDEPASAVRFQQRVAFLRAQAERNLRGILTLERALTGNVNPAKAAYPNEKAKGYGGTVAPRTSVGTSLAVLRQQLTESQTVRHILDRELVVAERHIDSLEERRESLEADLVKDRQACKASIADQVGALRTELDRTRAEAADLTDQRERLGLAYQHCRRRIARRDPTGDTGELQAARSEIDRVETTHSALQAQLVDATETASRCVARLADTDARMAALVAQIEQLEIAIDQNGSR